jgi:ABC-2 type transport system permease protein
MSKITEIFLKNMKIFLRDKKIIFIVFAIPVMLVLIMGVVFSGMSTGTNLSSYTIGYINMDQNSTVVPLNSYQSINSVINIITNESANATNLFKLKNYTSTINLNGNPTSNPDLNTSLENVQAALVKQEIAAAIVFEPGFQQKLNDAIQIKIGFFDNDSSNVGTIYTPNDTNSLITILQNLKYSVTNLSVSNFEGNFSQFKDSNFRYLLVLNSGYKAGIMSYTNISFTLFYHDGDNHLKAEIQAATLKGIFDQIIYGNSSSLLSINPETVSNSGISPSPEYTIYFSLSTNPTTKSIINQTINAIISNIINYNPNAVDFNVSAQSIQAVTISQITYSTPGLLIYSAMNIMSFATILLTNEVQNGLLRRLKSTRMKDFDLLAGHALMNVVLVFVEVGISLILLYLLGFNPFYYNILGMIIGLILTTFAIGFFMSSLSLTLTSVFKSPEAAGGGVWMVLIPLAMFSGVFFPLELMSPTLAAAVAWLPTRMAVLDLQAIFVDGLTLTDPKYWGNLLGLLGWGIGFFLLGNLTFRNFIKTSHDKSKKIKKDLQNGN